MDTLETCISSYLEYCNSQKCLDEKTMKAYRIDLRQFSEQIPIINIAEITSKTLEQYIARLHEQYKPKTAKRKIASVKALFRYLEYQDIIEHNPQSLEIANSRSKSWSRKTAFLRLDIEKDVTSIPSADMILASYFLTLPNIRRRI